MNRPVDENGVEHRPNCRLPAPTITPSTLPGLNLSRCPQCGAQRLTRRTTTSSAAARGRTR